MNQEAAAAFEAWFDDARWEAMEAEGAQGSESA